ncbi:MAG: Rpn family recombination-promoting nuclease/putative transposase [Lachnospiraceae bacterium]|nr:Rpn family recombination-promoting nuclease/putative transposase [Lachnospiraceae bacterium]
MNETQFNMQAEYKPLSEQNLSDDFLFDVVTVDLETCKDIIEIALNKKIKEIRWKEGQKTIRNLPGKRGIRMDFYVEDMEGNIFDVEMQKRNEGNIPKRTRFYQGLIDAPLLKSGERGFDKLNPSYIIVICCFDLFKKGLYKYTFENICLEQKDLSLGDGVTKIFLNTRGKNDAEVPKVLVDFLHYVEKSRADMLDENSDERLKRLHKKINHIKNDEQMEVSYMKMEERDRIIRESGEKFGQYTMIFRFLLNRGKTNVEEISKIFGEDRERIETMEELIRNYPAESAENLAYLLMQSININE